MPGGWSLVFLITTAYGKQDGGTTGGGAPLRPLDNLNGYEQVADTRLGIEPPAGPAVPSPPADSQMTPELAPKPEPLPPFHLEPVPIPTHNVLHSKPKKGVEQTPKRLHPEVERDRLKVKTKRESRNTDYQSAITNKRMQDKLQDKGRPLWDLKINAQKRKKTYSSSQSTKTKQQTPKTIQTKGNTFPRKVKPIMYTSGVPQGLQAATVTSSMTHMSASPPRRMYPAQVEGPTHGYIRPAIRPSSYEPRYHPNLSNCTPGMGNKERCQTADRGCPRDLPDHSLVRNPETGITYMISGGAKHAVRASGGSEESAGNCFVCPNAPEFDFCDPANLEVYGRCVRDAYKDGPDYDCSHVDLVTAHARDLCPQLPDYSIVSDGRRHVYVLRGGRKMRVVTCRHCGVNGPDFCSHVAKIDHPCVAHAYPDGGVFDCKVDWSSFVAAPACPHDIANYSIVRAPDPNAACGKPSVGLGIYVVVSGRKQTVPSCFHCGANFDFCACDNVVVDDKCVNEAWGVGDSFKEFNCEVDFAEYLSSRPWRGRTVAHKACERDCPPIKTVNPSSNPTFAPTRSPTTRAPSRAPTNSAVEITLHAWTMNNTAQDAGTSAAIMASFLVKGAWEGPFDFFDGAELGEEKSVEIMLTAWPTVVELAAMSTDPWGVWRLWMSTKGGTRVYEITRHQHGVRGEPYKISSPFWLGSPNAYSARQYSIPARKDGVDVW